MLAMLLLADATTPSSEVHVSLSPADWVKIFAMALGQVTILAGALWRFASRIGSLETKVDLAINTQLADHDHRLSRLEAPYFSQPVNTHHRSHGNPQADG